MKFVRRFLFVLLDGPPGRFESVRALRYKLLRAGDRLPDGSVYVGTSALDGTHVLIEQDGAIRRDPGRAPADDE